LRMELGCFLEGSLGFFLKVIWLIFPEIYYLEKVP
jgi:hypothetical protein